MTHSDLIKILNHPDAFTDDGTLKFPDDCKILKTFIDERYGVSISLTECEQLWERYSDEADAQWLDPNNCTAGEVFEAAVSWARSFFKDVP